MERILKLIIEFLKFLFGGFKSNPAIENNEEPATEEVVEETVEEPVIEEKPEEETALDEEPEEVVLGSASPIKILIDNGHGSDTAGKRSPYAMYKVEPALDFREWKWNREIAAVVVERLKALGYDAELLVTEENDISLSERVARVNKVCNKVGAANVLLLSIHANAAGNGKEWTTARGWCAYTTRGLTKSDKFADCLYDAAEKNFKGMKIRVDKSDGDRDKEADFYIIKKSYCPAVLTENFFYDNVEDTKYILSEEGREQVIKTHEA